MKSRQTGVGQSHPLTETLVLAFCVPAASALPLLLLLFGVDLVPVGLAVLVDQSDLRWEGCGADGRLRVSPCLAGFWPLVLVLSGERQNDVSIQDAQSHTGHGVLEVVLGGETVVEPCVRLVERLQEDTLVGFQDSSNTIQHFPLPLPLEEPLDCGLRGTRLTLQEGTAALHPKLHRLP